MDAAKFTDDSGRDWFLRLDYTLARQIRAALAIDLIDLKGQAAALARMADAPELLVDTVWLIVEAQAKRLGLTDEDFGRGLGGGEAFERAAVALQECLAFFLRPQDRSAFVMTREILTGARRELLTQATNDLRSTFGESPSSCKPSAESATSAP